MANKKKEYKIKVIGGKGIDWLGIERDYSEFLRNGTIGCSIPQDDREYYKYTIHDADTGRKWEYDFGKLHGRAVIPIQVRVYFGKSDYVKCGYQMRKDGSFYYCEGKCFRLGRNKKYNESRFRELHEKVLASPKGDSLMLGWLLPDETKEAIEAELKEATSGKYRFEVLFDYI